MTETYLRILIVGGHPADAFDNAGGTLAHHAARGDQVTALVLTQGTRVHDVVIAEELRQRDRMPPPEALDALMQERMQVKQREVREACAIMGFTDVRFLTYSDSVLMLREEIIEAIARLIREVRPHIVITHYPFDDGGIANQHAITGQLVLNGMNAAGSVGRGDSNPPHRVAQVFFMATPIGLHHATVLSAEPIAYPDVYVDISDVIERKIKALDCLESQQYAGAYARKRAEAVDGSLGLFMRVPYAEAFIRYKPELHDYLPLGPHAVERANELESATHARMNVLVAHKVPLQE